MNFQLAVQLELVIGSDIGRSAEFAAVSGTCTTKYSGTRNCAADVAVRKGFHFHSPLPLPHFLSVLSIDGLPR